MKRQHIFIDQRNILTGARNFVKEAGWLNQIAREVREINYKSYVRYGHKKP